MMRQRRWWIRLNRLRAFTANDQKELKQAADTYRPNPAFDTVEAIREVGPGEAVTSMLMDKGVPGIVERTLIRPPSSQLGPITKGERAAVMAESPMSGKYDERLDRNSVAEMLAKCAGNAAAEAEAAEAEEDKLEEEAREHRKGRRYTGKDVERSTSRRSSTSDTSWGGAIAAVVAKELKGTTGCRMVRRILGGLFKGR